MKNENTKYHKPVLLEEALSNLQIKPGEDYIDCTLGEGGHSIEILKKLSKKGSLLSLDRDQDAIDFVKEHYKKKLEENKNWTIKKANFKNINEVLDKKVDGILMDLGLSSRQLEASKRGFSYLEGSQDLDMRMDEELSAKAIDLLNFYDEKSLARILGEFGEEKNARRIAKFIKQNIKEIKKVQDLNNVILRAVPAAFADKHKHPSRRVFQALRIAVNDELGNLREGLEKSFDCLNDNGRIVVISFHSLEDRIVKRFFKEKGMKGEIIIPTKEEIKRNPRSRSAKMRVLIKKIEENINDSKS
jgi:16S rRNA (cytosine1402-N4)-methyltransferase